MKNTSTSLKRHNVTVDKFYEALKQFKVSERPEERMKEEFIKFTPSQNMENADGPNDVASAYLMNSLPKPAKVICFNSPFYSDLHMGVPFPIASICN